MLWKILTTLFLLASASAQAAELNVYSARKEKLIKPLLNEFTQETGIKVNLVTSKADVLLKKLESEGAQSPADVLITTDAGRLHRAKTAEVLQPIKNLEMLKPVKEEMRDKAHYWTGLSVRARTIVYAKGRFKNNRTFTYQDLASGAFKGKVCIRSSNNIYNQSLVAGMIEEQGHNKTLDWAKGLVKNLARTPVGGDRDQIKALAAGICDLAVVNTYYLAGMLNSKDAVQVNIARKAAVLWPNQKTTGVHVNVSGIGITKSSKNYQAAEKLIAFLLRPKSQQWYAEVNNEYPITQVKATNKTLEGWGSFKQSNVNLSRLGELNPDAVRIMDKAGWK